MKVTIVEEILMAKKSQRWNKLTGRLMVFCIGLLALALGEILIQRLVYAAADPISGGVSQLGKCSIANGEIIKIASWNINGLSYKQRRDAAAFKAFVSMVDRIDADVFAFQEVTPAADEIVELVSALQGGRRCYQALVSAEADGEKYALLYDEKTVELLYPKGLVGSCDTPTPVRVKVSSPLMRQAPNIIPGGKPSQLAYFRVQGKGQTRNRRFDFTLINAHVSGSDLDRLVADFDSLDRSYPWLVGEQDRIITGDLGIGATPGQLRGNYFPQMKPLINPLLMISLGLSDMTFDEAVGRMSSSSRPSVNGAERLPEHYDNILVRRWDRPGTCPAALYCGGLEEFINARVYQHDQMLIDTVEDFDVTVSDHSPIAARFCRNADTDPFIEVGL